MGRRTMHRLRLQSSRASRERHDMVAWGLPPGVLVADLAGVLARNEAVGGVLPDRRKPTEQDESLSTAWLGWAGDANKNASDAHGYGVIKNRQGVRSQRLFRRFYSPALCRPLIGSRVLAAYDDVDGPSAANNRPWSRKCTARLLRRSDASASAHGYVGTRSVRLGGAGSVG